MLHGLLTSPYTVRHIATSSLAFAYERRSFKRVFQSVLSFFVSVISIVRRRWLLLRDFFDVTIDSLASINRHIKGREGGGLLSSIEQANDGIYKLRRPAAIYRISHENITYRFRSTMLIIRITSLVIRYQICQSRLIANSLSSGQLKNIS